MSHHFASGIRASRPLDNGRGESSISAWVRLDWHCLLVVAALWLFAVPPVLAVGPNPEQLKLALITRAVKQDQGAWVVDYRLQHTGQTGVIVTPNEFAVKVQGWVSNSRLVSHAVPRWSSLSVARGSELSAVSEVITGADDLHRCRERLVVSVWTDAPDHSAHNLGKNGQARMEVVATSIPIAAEPIGVLPISLGPGANLYVRLRFEHQHVLYGDYDPLLGVRTITLTLGSATVRDVVPLDREQYLAQPKSSWSDPPGDRLDTRYVVSGPTSLHLEADAPGHQYYRYPERRVRYNTKMRLRFWYLIAAGTEGECRIRIAQFEDTPTSFRMLHNGDFEKCLKTVGRWAKEERIVQTELEATTLTLEFRIVGETDIGEMWIDDVSLEPLGCVVHGGP